jgi:light-regulated signal transduction histidine kinase (bacteriophytochrome)
MTETEYNALPGLRATELKAGATSMRHMRAVMLGQRSQLTESKAWGSIVHGAILEPERFWRGVATWKGEAKSGKEWADFKAAHAGQIVEDAVELAGIEMRRRNVAIQTYVAQRLPLLMVDPILIEQVVLNLLKNAAEAIDTARLPPQRPHDRSRAPASRR